MVYPIAAQNIERYSTAAINDNNTGKIEAPEFNPIQ